MLVREGCVVSKPGWQTIQLTKEDMDSFKVKETYKMEAHQFRTDVRVGGKQYCTKCGLLALNNEFTSWSIKMGCNSESHPSYQQIRSRCTKLT